MPTNVRSHDGHRHRPLPPARRAPRRLPPAARGGQEASRRDDGCLNYGYYSNITDPASYIAVEEWRDMDALAAHLRTEHVGRLIAAIGEMADGGLEIAAHEVARSGPLPLPS